MKIYNIIIADIRFNKLEGQFVFKKITIFQRFQPDFRFDSCVLYCVMY